MKSEYYIKLLTPETIKFIGSTKTKISKKENSENVLHLEITEVVLVHCNINNNNYQQDSRACIYLSRINCFINCYLFHLKTSFFKNLF